MKALGKKILAVMEDVDHIAKDARNDFHKYDYVSDAAVVKVMRAELIKHRLVLAPNHLSSGREGELTTVCVEYTLYDIDSDEFLKSCVIGYGSDKGDKGIYKAMTGAEKYFFTKTFLIPTDDDPEKETKTKAAFPPKHSATNIKPSWPAPKLSAQLEKPATPVAQELRNIVDRTIGLAQPDLVQEILDRLNQEADGDEEQMANLLREATTWTPKGTSTQKWLKPEDLERIAKSKPEWIERIHARIVTN